MALISLLEEHYYEVLIAILTCALIIRGASTIYTEYVSPLHKIPGPILAPYTILPLKYAIITGSRTSYIHELHKNYGPVVRIAPEEISISDVDAFKTIHSLTGGFLKTEWYGRVLNKPHDGIFEMTDPKKHAIRRKMFGRAFQKSEMRSRWESEVRSKVKLAISRIKEGMAVGEVDILKWFIYLAADINGQLMFGESFRMLENGQKNEFMSVLETAAKGFGLSAELPLVGFIGRHIPHPTCRTMFRPMDYLISYGEQALRNGRASGNGSVFTQIEPVTDYGSKSNAPITDFEMSIEAGGFILAGTDTTAYTLTYIVWCVLAHPSVQETLEKEVAGLAADVSDAELEALPFLNAVINETMRIYPIVGGSLPRCAPRGGATLGGYYIPEGLSVDTQAWTLHRDEKYWPNPEKFDPYRWLTNPPPIGAKVAFAPWGAGTRICLGLHQALMELRITTAYFFRECNGSQLAPITANQGLDLVDYFLMKPKAGQCVIVGR